MKIVASWPDYSVPGIIAVADDGTVFQFPILDNGRVRGTKWLPLAPPIGAKRKTPIQRFDDGLRMSEPLHETTEVSWRSFLDRFDTIIWPVLFARRGYTKGEALIAWSISRLEESINELKEEVREMRQ